MHTLYSKYKEQVQQLKEQILLNDYLGRYEKFVLISKIDLMFLDLIDRIITEFGFAEQMKQISESVEDTTVKGNLKQLPWQKESII